jgi:hypothetical protein
MHVLLYQSYLSFYYSEMITDNINHTDILNATLTMKRRLFHAR